MKASKFLTALCSLILLFIFAKIFQYNRMVSKLYELQSVEAHTLTLHEKLDEQRIALAQLRAPAKVAERAREKGFVPAHHHRFMSPCS